MIHRTIRLNEILHLMTKQNVEPKLQFIYPKEGEESNMFLIEGIKGGKPGLKVLEPLIIHDKEGNYLEK